MENPLPYDDQDVVLQSQFNQLLNAIIAANDNGSEEEIKALNELVQREVTANPILAKIVQGNSSLLDACINLTTCRYEQFHPAIKFLIEANPSALLWQPGFATKLIHKVANHPSHCVLMPWIATNYQWVLDNEICLRDPPVFYLLERYINGATRFYTATIRQFFEAYPRGLTQVGEFRFTPLHAILIGSAECEADLFKWIADQCPTNMLRKDNSGMIPLHIACRSLSRRPGYNSRSEICKYLIEQCPESVQTLDNYRQLPIHFFLDDCQHRVVKEVVVCLLREYPESYNTTSEITAASSIPFIQRIKPLLDEERELKENAASLEEVSAAFQDAMDSTQNPSSLASSTCDTFYSWATVFVKRLQARKEQILSELQAECNAEEEQDREHAIDE